MNESVKAFKPDDITVCLGDKEYRLIYDLNAFAELEKIYDSVDSILQMLLGTNANPDLSTVPYFDKPVNADDIKIADVTLTEYITRLSSVREAKHTDTLNLLWAGCLHDCAIYNSFGDITGYTVTKARLGAEVTLKNMREVNAKILTALLRDLLPGEEIKNVEAPVMEQAEASQETKGPSLTIRK